MQNEVWASVRLLMHNLFLSLSAFLLRPLNHHSQRAMRCIAKHRRIYKLVFTSGLRNGTDSRKFSRVISSRIELIGRTDCTGRTVTVLWRWQNRPLGVAHARTGWQRIIQSKRIVKPLTSAVKYLRHRCGNAGGRRASSWNSRWR